jgi:hypothetical protein
VTETNDSFPYFGEAREGSGGLAKPRERSLTLGHGREYSSGQPGGSTVAGNYFWPAGAVGCREIRASGQPGVRLLPGTTSGQAESYRGYTRPVSSEVRIACRNDFWTGDVWVVAGNSSVRPTRGLHHCRNNVWTGGHRELPGTHTSGQLWIGSAAGTTSGQTDTESCREFTRPANSG